MAFYRQFAKNPDKIYRTFSFNFENMLGCFLCEFFAMYF
ncbi:hypothetical protein BV121_252 [Haemophilus influenzae]|nr:hypothetical protein BV121_252 [Haemophilus influenzae]AVJ00730.1 hypothetical protein BV122_252 [Haemophilus influenzae]